MAPPKRRAPSTQPSSQVSSTSSAQARPKKRVRRDLDLDQSTLAVDPPVPQPAHEEPPASNDESLLPSALPLPLALPEAKKRVIHPGSLRKLSSGHPRTTLPNQQTREKQTLNGNRIGGKSKDLKDGVQEETIWVSSTRKNRGNGNQKGVGFSGWLKRGVGTFVERGCTCLKIHGMGATIPTALSLALAIRDAVPGGSPLTNDTGDEDDILGSGSEDEGQGRIGRDEVGEGAGTRTTGGIFKLEVRTGTTVVGDEITPEDDDEDMIYQTRSKSTVEVTLRLDEELAKLVGFGKQVKRGNQSKRGGKRRGARGRGGGTTRG